MGRMSFSLTPRLTTMSIFTGARPASAALSIASSTLATGKPTSFIDWNTVSSSESRLTVTRLRPAALSARARSGVINEPLVVMAMSSSALDAGQHLDQLLEVAAQHRLAAGEAHLLDAQLGEDARQARDLLEAEQLVRATGRRSRGRRPPSACSRCSGRYSGP